MKTYKIQEIFYSLQGEGGRIGTPNVFIRFSDCNLECGFCDTEFVSGVMMTGQQIAERVAKLMPAPRAVILTGGEPAMQYDQALHDDLRGVGVSIIAIETNGSLKINAPTDYIACSPKVAEHVLKRSFPDGVQELKYVRHPGQSIPQPSIKADLLMVSPEFRGDNPWLECVEYCSKLVKENPSWRLSLQTHKLLKIR